MAASHLVCIIGYPVEQSLSPAIHNAAFAALGLDWTYTKVPVQPGAAAEGIALLRTLGVDGANVTMPHKQAVIAHLDGLAGDAPVVGAVNTIVRTGAQQLIGHNTDGEGFLSFLRTDVELDPAGSSTLIVGAGGAARAVAVALARAGAKVRVAARRAAQAAEVAALADGIEVCGWGSFGKADLIINATPSRARVEAISIARTNVVVDMIYAPPPTTLLQAAREAGARAFDGLGMLVHQAAASFELWTGQTAPLAVMREAAERAPNL